MKIKLDKGKSHNNPYIPKWLKSSNGHISVSMLQLCLQKADADCLHYSMLQDITEGDHTMTFQFEDAKARLKGARRLKQNLLNVIKYYENHPVIE